MRLPVTSKTSPHLYSGDVDVSMVAVKTGLMRIYFEHAHVVLNT